MTAQRTFNRITPAELDAWLAQHPSALLLDARDKPDVKREPLGEKEIDGHRVVGFRVNTNGAVVSLWGDPKTGLPVRVEVTTAMHPDVKSTMSDFVFNLPMDESLFSIDPPPGYTVQNQKVDVSPAEEKDLIGTFRIYSELSGGAFPDSLDTRPVMEAAGTLTRPAPLPLKVPLS